MQNYELFNKIATFRLYLRLSFFKQRVYNYSDWAVVDQADFHVGTEYSLLNFRTYGER